MKLRNVAVAGALSLSGLGLIGLGAHATFSANTASSQTITAGTPGLALWASNATNACTSQSAAQTYESGCNSITLTTPADVSSVFDALSSVGVLNYGNVPVSLNSFTASEVNDGTSAGGCASATSRPVP